MWLLNSFAALSPSILGRHKFFNEVAAVRIQVTWGEPGIRAVKEEHEHVCS